MIDEANLLTRFERKPRKRRRFVELSMGLDWWVYLGPLTAALTGCRCAGLRASFVQTDGASASLVPPRCRDGRVTGDPRQRIRGSAGRRPVVPRVRELDKA